MKLTLTYSGELPSAQGKGRHRKDVQHAMRKEFHQQLLDKWQNSDGLKQYADKGFRFLEKIPGSAYDIWSLTPVPTRTARFQFLPLVINGRKLKLACELIIKILWRDDPGAILSNRGDIDNRLKVIFDALQIPQANALPADAFVAEDENPFLCLLEDDKLITDLHIHTERLLRRLRPDEDSRNVELTIDAVIQSTDRSKWRFD